MKRQTRAPEWLKQLIDEFTKPPAFFEPLMDSAQTPGESRESSPQHPTSHSYGTRSPSGWPAAHPSTADQTPRSWTGTLQQLDLPVTLPGLYGWQVRKADRVDSVARVDCTDHIYAVKQTDVSPRRVQFLYAALQFATKNGFSRFAPIQLTRKGKPYVLLNEKTYYATEWLSGNPVNFASTEQLGQTARTLAQFHQASRGFESDNYNPPMEFRLLRMNQQRAENLRDMLATAARKRQPDEFDRTLLQLEPALRRDAQKSLDLLRRDDCVQFLNADEQRPGICHLDVIPGNFVYDRDKIVRFLDPDLATFAPRVLDLAHLLRRALQRNHWNSEVAYACFKHYNDVHDMQPEEYFLTQAMLTFPYRAWRLAHTRYNLFRDSNQVEDIKLYAEQEERRQSFLQALEREITRVPVQ